MGNLGFCAESEPSSGDAAGGGAADSKPPPPLAEKASKALERASARASEGGLRGSTSPQGRASLHHPIAVSEREDGGL